MKFVNGILTELRDSRLWPVAVALVAGLIAVPLLLARHAAGGPLAPAGPAAGGPGSASPVVLVDTGNGSSRLLGRGRDPFSLPGSQPVAPSVTAVATTSNTGAGGAAATSGTSSSTTGGSSSGGGGGAGNGGSSTTGTTTGSTTPPDSTPSQTPNSGPPGLTSTQSYRVSLSITGSGGGVSAVDSLERLSPLPSPHQPLLIELGVLEGGQRILFAVEPGTVLRGPGVCTPGPLDCEILSLARNRTEGISASSTKATVWFAITAIKADEHPSPSAASTARAATSAAGRDLLRKLDLAALSLFQYDSDIGAIVDLRNLSVGGG